MKAKQLAKDARNLLTRHEIRVAVCGMQNSGKTVFLTALADHLLHHDPEKNQEDNRRFDLGDYVVADDADISDIHSPGDSITNFDYQKYRANFGENKWPKKTVGTSELVLDFTLENQKRDLRGVGGLSKRRSVRLRFLEKHSDIKTVIVVYLDDVRHIPPGRLVKNLKAAETAGVRLVEIIPSDNIGRGITGWQGVFDASPETAKRLMELGRKDAKRKLREERLIE